MDHHSESTSPEAQNQKPNTKALNITICVPANLKFGAGVRQILGDAFDVVGFEKMWQEKLKMIIDELFMNAVKYGSKEDESIVTIQAKAVDNGIMCSVSDRGQGKKQITAQELKKIIETNKNNTDITKISGRGLAMFTSEWTDSFEIQNNEDNGISVTFEKFIPPEETSS